MMNNSSAIAEFKKQADKLIEEEVHEMYNKSPSNVSLGKKHWPDVWKRLQSLNSRVQIFDHPMKYQPVLDHLWQKYADLVEQTNAILKPHGESAKEIIAEAEDSDEEEVAPPVQQQTSSSSGWSKHVGHAASAKYGVDAAKPVLPTQKTQQLSPEKVVKAEITTQPEITEKSSSTPVVLQPENKMKPLSPEKQNNNESEMVPPLPPASIPLSSSNGLPSNLNYAEMLDKMHNDKAFAGEKRGMAKIRVSTEDLAAFIMKSKEYYERTNDEDMLDELLNLIERDGDCTEVTIEGWMADLYIDFKSNGFQQLNVEKFEKQRQREKFQAQVGMVDVEFEQGAAIGGDIDLKGVGDLMKAAAQGGVKGIEKIKNKRKVADSGMDEDGGAGRGEEDLDFNLHGDDSDDENENLDDSNENNQTSKNISILQNEEESSAKVNTVAVDNDIVDEADKYLGQNDEEDDPMLTAEDMLIKKNLLANQKLRKQQKEKGVSVDKLAKAARTSKQIKDEMGMLTDMFSNNLYDSKESAEKKRKEAKKAKRKSLQKSSSENTRKPSDETDILLPPPVNTVSSHLMPLGMAPPKMENNKNNNNNEMSDDDEGVLLAPTMQTDSAGLKIQKQLNRKRRNESGEQMETDQKISPTKRLKLADKPIYKSPGQIKAEEKQAKKLKREAKRMKKAKKQAKKEIEELRLNLKPGSLLKMGTKIESTSGPSKKKKVNAWLESQADKKRTIKAMLKEGAKNMSLKGGEFDVTENLGHRTWDKLNAKQSREAAAIGQSVRMEEMLKSKERTKFMLAKMQEIEQRTLATYEDVAF